MMSEQAVRPKVKCELHLEFESSADAEGVHRAIQLDNEGYVTTRVEGRLIHAEIEANSLNSLLHTLDDLLACANVAHKIVGKKN